MAVYLFQVELGASESSKQDNQVHLFYFYFLSNAPNISSSSGSLNLKLLAVIGHLLFLTAFHFQSLCFGSTVTHETSHYNFVSVSAIIVLED